MTTLNLRILERIDKEDTIENCKLIGKLKSKVCLKDLQEKRNFR